MNQLSTYKYCWGVRMGLKPRITGLKVWHTDHSTTMKRYSYLTTSSWHFSMKGECNLTSYNFFCTSQENNRLLVVQSLVIHESLIKHKVVLDQFRKGLTLLGLLEEIEKEPLGNSITFLSTKKSRSTKFLSNLKFAYQIPPTLVL